jgi:peptidoglycan/LPS O-acetylase OafA/YrhL
MMIPQAWTLSLELMFYIICPFFIKMRLRLLLGLIFFLITLKLVSVACGYTNDPWTYRFFPFEGVFFLAGIVAYTMYKKLSSLTIKPFVFVSILAYIILFTLFFKQLPGEQLLKLVYLVSVFLSIPFLFIYTKKNRLDRKIGDLSYPMYISHILVMNVTDLLTRKISMLSAYRSDVVLVLTVILSLLLIKLIGDRFENIRHKKIHIEQQRKPLPIRF